MMSLTALTQIMPMPIPMNIGGGDLPTWFFLVGLVNAVFFTIVSYYAFMHFATSAYGVDQSDVFMACFIAVVVGVMAIPGWPIFWVAIFIGITAWLIVKTIKLVIKFVPKIISFRRN